MLESRTLAVTALSGDSVTVRVHLVIKEGTYFQLKKTTLDGASREPILSLLKGLFAEVHISAPNTRNETERYSNR